LSLLNDGLGVEDGMMCITVAGDGRELDIYVDLTNVTTVGDIIDAVNTAIKNAVADEPYGDLAEGLKLTINDDKNGFSLTGMTGGYTYEISNVWGADESGNVQMANPQTVNQLGLIGAYTAKADGDSFEGLRVLGDMSSPMIGNLSGANGTGIGSEDSYSYVSAGALTGSTLLKHLNGGNGLENASDMYLYIYEGGDDHQYTAIKIADGTELRALLRQDDATVDDLLDYLNGCLSQITYPGMSNLKFEIDSDAKGIYLSGLPSEHDYSISDVTGGGLFAQSLGLMGTYYGSDTSNADIQHLFGTTAIADTGGMIWATMTLSEVNDATTGVAMAQADIVPMLANPLNVEFTVNGTAYNVSVDLSTLDPDTATLQDIIDAVNTAIADAVNDPTAVVPRLDIHSSSDGLAWFNVDTSTNFKVTGDAADRLGFSKNYTGATYGTFETGVHRNLNPVMVGTCVEDNLTGSELLAELNAGAGLDFSGTELTFTFGPDGSSSIISISREELIAALEAINFHYTTNDLNDYISVLNTLVADKIAAHATLGGTGAELVFGISADGLGIEVISAIGLNDGDPVTIGGDMATAGSTGLAATTFDSETAGVFTPTGALADIRGVTSTAETIAGLGSIYLTIPSVNGGNPIELSTAGLDQYSTLADLIGVLNKQLESTYGITNMYFGISDSGSGISFTNDSGEEVTFHYNALNTLASDLGLVGTEEGSDTVVAANSHLNNGSLNRNYIGRATTLASLNGGAGADQGVITVTNAQGTSVNIDLTYCVTMGDVIDAINGSLYGVNARINDAGDGIVIEQTAFYESDGSLSTGNITVTTADGTKTAEHLGLAGVGVGGEEGTSVLNGSLKTVIEVGPNDTLTDLMNRITDLDAGYKCSIINDGSGSASYRLSISASSSGSGSDFIIDTDLDVLGFQQVSKGQDSMLLYGQPDSGMSPVVLRASTNTNNQAILGLTLELTEASESYTTITVKTDTDGVVEEIQNLVQAYNDLSDLITYLDSFDYENDTKGILFGDSTIRNLMDTIDNMFYQIFNPDNLSYSELQSSSTKQAWTWTDLGISFSANNTATDDTGVWYSRMDLALAVLTELVAPNWD
ncbi:MAG: flagellar filament capping protein FliD, partial [Planctomycetes bacterium]|nr:flagellar filament capping protein FliD [Planctomycetota bacterium]